MAPTSAPSQARPVRMPPGPALLWMLAYLLPPTYAADALRQALPSTIGMSFFVDLAVLLVLTFVGVGMVGRWLRWRVA